MDILFTATISASSGDPRAESSGLPEGQTGYRAEMPSIQRRDRPAARDRGGRDEEVVGWRNASTQRELGPQPRVHPSDAEVERDDRDRFKDAVDEHLTPNAILHLTAIRPLQKLGRGDRRDREVVPRGELDPRPLVRDQDRRIDEDRQGSLGGLFSSRRARRTSAAKRGSGPPRSSRSRRRSAPVNRRPPVPAAAILATGRRFRSTTNSSPRCSTRSSTSEKFRAASVAEILFTPPSYQKI